MSKRRYIGKGILYATGLALMAMGKSGPGPGSSGPGPGSSGPGPGSSGPGPGSSGPGPGSSGPGTHHLINDTISPTMGITSKRLGMVTEDTTNISSPGSSSTIQTAITSQGIVQVIPPNGQQTGFVPPGWPAYYVDGTPIHYDPNEVRGDYRPIGITGIQNPNHPLPIGIIDPNATRTPTYAPDYTPVRTDGQFWYSADGTIVSPEPPFRPIDPSQLPGGSYRSPNADEINKGLGTNY